MWTLHMEEMGRLDNVAGYIDGSRGLPHIPDNADDEIKEIRRLSVHNVLTLVRDAFVQNLSVVGYRSTDAEQNAAGWDVWQANQMDARQAEIYSSAVKYGAAYVVVEPGEDGPMIRPRSPRQLVAIYGDPQVDRWPQAAFESWVDTSKGEPRRKGFFIDDVSFWPLDLGPVSAWEAAREADGKNSAAQRLTVTLSGDGSIGDPIPHGAMWRGRPVCPVVRFVNRRDSENLVEGEIERLIVDQRAINEVNFDRLIVARFGAFPQTVLSNWEGMPEDVQKVIKASARRVWAFDEDVKATRLPAASLEPYNGLLEALEVHVAMRAQISPAYVTGKMVNLSADALAAADGNMHRKLGAMRESHGESHEQWLQLAASMGGHESPDDTAEAVWKDTEARAFGALVDGIFKIGTALGDGLPIGPLLPLIPGLTPQMIAALTKQAEQAQQKAEAQTVTDLVTGLRNRAQATRDSNPGVAALVDQRSGQDGAVAAAGEPGKTA